MYDIDSSKNLDEAGNKDRVKIRDRLKGNPNIKELLIILQKIVDKQTGLSRQGAISSVRSSYLSATEEARVSENIKNFLTINSRDSLRMKFYLNKLRSSLPMTRSYQRELRDQLWHTRRREAAGPYRQWSKWK